MAVEVVFDSRWELARTAGRLLGWLVLHVGLLQPLSDAHRWARRHWRRCWALCRRTARRRYRVAMRAIRAMQAMRGARPQAPHED